MESGKRMIFCTLFDSNYIDKGLALYKSMENNICDFKLYIFAFDEKAYEVLLDMKLNNVKIIPLNAIMTPSLAKIREERTCAEFCWTCTPLVIEHVLTEFNEAICTYIDADIYFFSSPSNIIQEIIDNNCSVGLVKHNFERDCEYGKHVFEVGKYCIQFNTFLNNQIGLQVLRDWKENCLKWCYHRLEDGKLGDQKYPDKWRQRYEGIYESRNLGAGVAPWNLHLFTYISSRNREIWMKSKAKIFKVVFYHFEGMKYLGRDDICLNIWNPCVEKTGKKIKILYGEYLREIRDIRTFLDKKYGVTFEHMLISKDIFLEKDYSLMQFCKDDGIIDGLKKWMKYRKYNIVRINKIT